MRKALALAVASFGLLCLRGCSAEPTGPARNADGAPAFRGPWSAAFAEAWSNSSNQLQRTILSDEKISERENQEVQDRFVSCMAGLGATVTWDTDGGFRVAPKDNADPSTETTESVTKCESETTGPISQLFYQVRSNPDNRDIYELIASCLVSKELVESTYSARDYQSDFESDTFPFSPTDEAFKECNVDPLGLNPQAPH